MQHQVKHRRGTTGSHDSAVNDITVGPHITAGKACGEVFQILPMRGGGAPFKQPGAAKQPCAGLDTADGPDGANGPA